MLYLTLNPNKPGELDRLSAITSLLVRYHSPGCGHCVAMKEEWAALKNHKKLKDKDITVIDVESSLTPQIKHKSARLPESQGVPTIVFIQGDKVKEHKGAREADAMANFAIEQMGQSGGGKRKGTKRKSRKKSKKIHSIKRKPIIKGTRNIRNKRLLVKKKKRRTIKRRRNKRKGKRRTNRRKTKKGGMNQEDEDDELVRVAVPGDDEIAQLVRVNAMERPDRDENEEQDEEDQLVRVRFGRLPPPNFENLNEIEDNPPNSSSSAATSSSSALGAVTVRRKRGGRPITPKPPTVNDMLNQHVADEAEERDRQIESRRHRHFNRLQQERVFNTSSEEQSSCNVAGCTVMGGRKKTRKRKKRRSKRGGTAGTRGQKKAAKGFTEVEDNRLRVAAEQAAERRQAQIAKENADLKADEEAENRKQCTVMGGRKKTKKRKKRRSKKYN